MDQGGQTGSDDDAAQLSPVPDERGAAVAHHHRLEPGKPLAAAGAATENRELVPNKFAAAIGEDGRTAGQACPVLIGCCWRKAI